MNATSKGYGDPFFAEVYDHVVPYRDRADVEFFVALARQSRGPVLELGCGTGRVLIPTARAGIQTVGLDSARPMLDVCRRKLGEEPAPVQERVHLVEADMSRFDLDREFALITTPFRPFQHMLTVEDQLSCLARVASHLAPDGRFVLDVFQPDPARLADRSTGESAPEPEFRLPDGRRVTRRHRIVARDLVEQWIDVDMIHDVRHPDGRAECVVRSFRLRYYYRFELEHLLVRAGLQVEAEYGGFDGSGLGSEPSGELILVARKPPAATRRPGGPGRRPTDRRAGRR